MLDVAEVAGLEHAFDGLPCLIESRLGGRETCTGGLGITFVQSLPQWLRDLGRLVQREIGIAPLFVEPQAFLAMSGRLIADRRERFIKGSRVFVDLANLVQALL